MRSAMISDPVYGEGTLARSYAAEVRYMTSESFPERNKAVLRSLLSKSTSAYMKQDVQGVRHGSTSCSHKAQFKRMLMYEKWDQERVGIVKAMKCS